MFHRASQLAAKGIDPSQVASFTGERGSHADFYELTAVATNEDDEGEFGFGAEEDQDAMPRDMFNRQISDPTAANAQPVALKTAMK
jgi:hypothetical protein